MVVLIRKGIATKTHKIHKGYFHLLCFLCLFVAIFPRLLTAQLASPIPEYRVKATFLFQFTQFVDWPQDGFATDRAPFVIGILGDDPFGNFLDETVRDEKANGRPVVVARYRRLEDVKDCQLLFVARAEAARIRQIAEALRGLHVLTLGDADGFADRGGMIQFVTQENKIRLRINVAAAREADITISSKLLRSATVINPGAK